MPQIIQPHGPASLSMVEQHSIDDAHWSYKQAKSALSIDNSEDFQIWAAECFWHLVFAHFKGFRDVYMGNYTGISLPTAIENASRAKDIVLLPKLAEIIRCENAQEKATLVCQYVWILMGAVFDPRGGTIYYKPMCEALEAVKLPDGIEEAIRCNIGKFLEPLGFKSFVWEDQGAAEFTSWYWPVEESPQPATAP